MKKLNVNISKRNEIFKKVITMFLGVLWIISTVLAFKAFKQPLRVEEKTFSNKIEEKTDFDYKVEVIPCALYPKGGIVTSTNATFTKVTKAIYLHLDSTVTSYSPVDVKGSKKVILKVIAENLWEKDFVIEDVQNFNMQGSKNTLVKGDYIIDVKNISEFIKKVEKDLQVWPEKYILKIKPEITGNIVYDNKKISIDSTPELTFEFSNVIKPIGEKEFIKEIPVETGKVIINNFKLGNMTLSLVIARVIFSICSLLFLVIVLLLISKSINKYKTVISEAKSINKKYGSRLKTIDNKINPVNKLSINLMSFKSLLGIADDKEQPILIYRCINAHKVIYYVIDGDCVYSYTADDGD